METTTCTFPEQIKILWEEKKKTKKKHKKCEEVVLKV
jgi:hypothetical protein